MAGGERLAQLAVLFVQAGLGSTLGAERLLLHDDDGSLPGVALFGLLLAIAGEIRAGLGGGDALLLHPDQQAERGDQGEAVEELADGHLIGPFTLNMNIGCASDP